jgi:hypothetical protein
MFVAYIATSYAFNPVLTPTPQAYDVHVYQTPSTLLHVQLCNYLPNIMLPIRLVLSELVLLRRLRSKQLFAFVILQVLRLRVLTSEMAPNTLRYGIGIPG